MTPRSFTGKGTIGLGHAVSTLRVLTINPSHKYRKNCSSGPNKTHEQRRTCPRPPEARVFSWDILPGARDGSTTIVRCPLPKTKQPTAGADWDRGQHTSDALDLVVGLPSHRQRGRVSGSP